MCRKFQWKHIFKDKWKINQRLITLNRKKLQFGKISYEFEIVKNQMKDQLKIGL